MQFQGKVDEWVLACFGQAVRDDPVERGHRFLEEAIELAQTNGVTREDCHKLVDYVFDRPPGEPFQEVGGVMVCLAALCNAAGINSKTLRASNSTVSGRWSKRFVQSTLPNRRRPLYREPRLTMYVRIAVSRQALEGVTATAIAQVEHRGENVSWRQAVEVEFAGWPANERSRAMQEIAEENDHAERLGFTCHPDDRRGFGRCYFMNGHRRVWQTADGWVGATCTGQVGFYGARDLFHTLDQALRNVDPFARLNRFGRREG